MTGVIVALLPVFLVILLGAGLRRFEVVNEQQWQAVDQLAYWVLFPALMFKAIAAADFSNVSVLAMAGAMMLAVIIMSAALLAGRTAICGALAIEGPAYASLFQGATRWHTFIALAIIPTLFGPQALALGAVGAAAMTPLLNLINVWVHAHHASPDTHYGRKLLRLLATNPFIFSTLGGVAWQLLGLPLPWPAYDVLDIVGNAALALAMLSVGAALRMEAFHDGRATVWLAVGLRLLVMPVLMFFCVKLLGVTGDAAKVALLCGAVPTGSGSYVLARQMGGDAPLMATILTVQVAAAALTLPLVLWLFT
jgi:malonate transporter and related proteins